MKTFIALAVLFWLIVGVATFAFNLPEWCAHPERPGNTFIQPLCPQDAK